MSATAPTTATQDKKPAPAVNSTEEKDNAPVNSSKEDLHKVFVGNLSFNTTDESLHAFFQEAGNVLETIIIKQGRRPKGYGFVAYGTLTEAEKAAKNLDKKELDGREISVQLAKPREVKPVSNTEKKKKRKNNKESRKNNQEDGDNEEKKVETVDSVYPVESQKQTTQEPKPKTSVFVANLPRSVKVDGLTELFKDFEVESALVAIQRNGRSKGYGFVELKTVDEMNRVLQEFVNIEVQGRPLHISIATSEKNTERKPKAKKKVTESEEETVETPKPAKKKNSRNRKSANGKKGAKEKEGSATNDAQEAVSESKEQAGVSHEAQEAVKESKKDEGVKATKETKGAKEESGAKAVTAAKKVDGVKSAAATDKAAE